MEYIREDSSKVEFTTVLEAMEQNEITVFHHFNGTEYQIITIAETTISHEKIVVYKALDSEEILVKKAVNFFKKVNKEKHSDVEQDYIIEPEIPMSRNYISLIRGRQYITLDLKDSQGKTYQLDRAVNK